MRTGTGNAPTSLRGVLFHHALFIALAAVGLGSASAIRPEPIREDGGAETARPRATAPLRFLADYATRSMKVPAGSGLTATFTRAIATIDPDADGTNVAVNDERFDESVRIAAVPAPSEGGFFERVFGPGGRLLASGVDHDGSLPLMIYHNFNNGQILVFHGDSLTPGTGPLFNQLVAAEVNITELTDRTPGPRSRAAQNNPTGGPFGDLLLNEEEPGAKALQPVTAVICHGAIIVGGPVWVHINSTTVHEYELTGWGFAINQDQGAGPWSLVWDDTGTAQPQLYLKRGREWCMRAAPIWKRGVSPPTAFSICCTDYVFKTWEPTPPPPY